MAPKPGSFRGLWLVLLLVIILLPWIPRQTSQAASFADLAAPGPYQAGYRTVTVARADATTFSATLYYPATNAGENAPFDSSGGPYPAITFAHGFLSEVSYYSDLLEHLATHGYFVIASLTYSGFVFQVDHAQFAHDVSDCLTYLVQQNDSAASPYYRQVKVSAFGASGHSMGGGVSILAASEDTRIKAVANMAAEADTTPPASTAIESVRMPVRLLAGSCDGITPLADHQQVLYNHANAPRQLAVFEKGTHQGFLEGPISFPESCSGGAMAVEKQLELSRAWITGWFDYYLKQDAALEDLIWGSGLTSDPLVSVQADPGATAHTPTPTHTRTPTPTDTRTPQPTRTLWPACESDCRFYFPFGR